MEDDETEEWCFGAHRSQMGTCEGMLLTACLSIHCTPILPSWQPLALLLMVCFANQGHVPTMAGPKVRTNICGKIPYFRPILAGLGLESSIHSGYKAFVRGGCV